MECVTVRYSEDGSRKVASVDRNKMTVAVEPAKPDDPNAQIAFRLRNFYHAVQEETLPQRFMDLLDKLDAVERGMQGVE
jgi:uncharacterized protein YutD